MKVRKNNDLLIFSILIFVFIVIAMLFNNFWQSLNQGSASNIATNFLSGGSDIEHESETIHGITKASAEEKPKLKKYVEITEGCFPSIGHDCVVAREAPTVTADIVFQLRRGSILEISETVEGEDGRTWHRIVFNEWLRYPFRVLPDWWVADENIRVFFDEGEQVLEEEEIDGNIDEENLKLTKEDELPNKYILVDRSDQKMYAYENGKVVMENVVSTGLEISPTPRGTFTIFRKTPSRFMQGPLPEINNKFYDLPGVPWNLYFTKQGGAIHGAYWHDNFGQPWSSGCVNLPSDIAKKIYDWAELGTTVIVRD